MIFAAVLVLYLLLAGCTFVWIAFRGRRFTWSSVNRSEPHSANRPPPLDPVQD
jgi:hypothetical protein